MIAKTTLAHCWLAMKERPAARAAAKIRRPSGWHEVSWGEYSSDIERAAAGLLSLGIAPGQHVAIMSNTRYEWACMDFAAQAIRAVTVPVYQNNTAEDTEYILNDSGAAAFVAENRNTLKIWRKIASNCPDVKKVICFETDNPGDPSLITWDQLLQMGAEYLASRPTAVADLAQEAKPHDVATILYTSGTTGKPKGVVLAHEQAISEVSEAFPLCGVTENDVSLSFLPYAHIFGRIEMWGHAYIGFTMGFAESIERIRQNLLDVKPTIMVSVPRIFEKIYAAISAQMENQPLKRRLFQWALDVGKSVSDKQMKRELVPLPLLAQHEVARRLVLDKIPQAFGGRLRFAVSGGSGLHRDISLFFHACGVLILEGYGLTETTAAITVNTPFNYRFGSVGRPIGDVQLRIAEDGEILVKSKKVMRSYYKNPQATEEVMTADGWFKTGDIGEILTGGDLRITDRKKDLIKTAGGKYVAPQRLEGLLKLNPIVGNALIHGNDRKYVVALLSLDRPTAERYAKEKNIPHRNWNELVEHPEIQALARNAVTEANSHLASWESIKRFLVVPEEFTVEGGELTPSLKVKRKVLDERYKGRIESLYG